MSAIGAIVLSMIPTSRSPGRRNASAQTGGGAVMTNHVTVGEKAKSLSRCRARGRSSKQRVSTYAWARQKAKET